MHDLTIDKLENRRRAIQGRVVRAFHKLQKENDGKTAVKK